MERISRVQTNKITIDSGKKVYNLASMDGIELGEFSFCPTDTTIIRRYDEVFAKFTELLQLDENMDVGEAAKKVECIIREQFDYLFGFPVSDSFFRDIKPLAILENNEIFAVYVLKTIGGVIDRKTAAAESSLQDRIDKCEEAVNVTG